MISAAEMWGNRIGFEAHQMTLGLAGLGQAPGRIVHPHSQVCLRVCYKKATPFDDPGLTKPTINGHAHGTGTD